MIIEMKRMLYMGYDFDAEPYIEMSETKILTHSLRSEMYDLGGIEASNDVWFGFPEGYEFETTRSMRGIWRTIKKGRRGVVAPHVSEPYAEVTQLAFNEEGVLDSRVYELAAPYRELSPTDGRAALIGATARALFDYSMLHKAPDVSALYERQFEIMEQAAAVLDRAAGLTGQN